MLKPLCVMFIVMCLFSCNSLYRYRIVTQGEELLRVKEKEDTPKLEPKSEEILLVQSKNYIDSFDLVNGALRYTEYTPKKSSLHYNGKSITERKDLKNVKGDYLIAHDGEDTILQLIDGKMKSLGIPAFQYSAISSLNDKLLFACKEEADSKWAIWIMNKDGSLPNYVCNGENPSWINSEQIVFNGLEDGRQAIKKIKLDGSQPVTVLKSDKHNYTRPDHHGHLIVYEKDAFQIEILDLKSNKRHNLSEKLSRDDLPTFSTNGNFISFRSSRNGYWGIWKKPLKIFR